jgi:glycosyltransferase involved in cell wall biosynthesis
MTNYPLDIILPVWNRPVEVRSALASFSTDTPMSRLVLVNNGSDRETERILDEFAEALDDRAILISTERNVGTVAALNLGLAKSTAPFSLIATPFTRLTPGWFDDVLAIFDRYPESGAVVLREKVGPRRSAEIEADSGSFVAMVLRKSLYDIAGGFDEKMDGGEWALRDFTRRALYSGFLTYSLSLAALKLTALTEFGSVVRRQEREQLARQLYSERWGEPLSYVIVCSESLFGVENKVFRETLLDSARQGNRIAVAAENRIGKLLAGEGFSALHENISFEILPKLFSSRALKGFLSKVAERQPGAVLVSESDAFSTSFGRMTFTDIASEIILRKGRFYKRGDI